MPPPVLMRLRPGVLFDSDWWHRASALGIREQADYDRIAPVPPAIALVCRTLIPEHFDRPAGQLGGGSHGHDVLDNVRDSTDQPLAIADPGGRAEGGRVEG